MSYDDEKLTVFKLIDGIHVYRAQTGHMPKEIVMTSNTYDELKEDVNKDLVHDTITAVVSDDENLVGAIMGVHIRIDDSAVDDYTRIA